MDSSSSMTIFLRQEIDCLQKVTTAVRSTLSELKLAIDGTIVMSENLRDALDNLNNARIPQAWLKVETFFCVDDVMVHCI